MKSNSDHLNRESWSLSQSLKLSHFSDTQHFNEDMLDFLEKRLSYVAKNLPCKTSSFSKGAKRQAFSKGAMDIYQSDCALRKEK